MGLRVVEKTKSWIETDHGLLILEGVRSVFHVNKVHFNVGLGKMMIQSKQGSF